MIQSREFYFRIVKIFRQYPNNLSISSFITWLGELKNGEKKTMKEDTIVILWVEYLMSLSLCINNKFIAI